MANGLPKLVAKDPFECYVVARDEADKYQDLANVEGIPEARRERLLAKRDAASRIARMIRFGEIEADPEEGPVDEPPPAAPDDAA